MEVGGWAGFVEVINRRAMGKILDGSEGTEGVEEAIPDSAFELMIGMGSSPSSKHHNCGRWPEPLLPLSLFHCWQALTPGKLHQLTGIKRL